jgi:hypothetical protein
LIWRGVGAFGNDGLDHFGDATPEQRSVAQGWGHPDQRLKPGAGETQRSDL